MILGKNKIEEAIRKGDIVITPFKEDRLNPNSYNVHLSNILKEYDNRHVLDPKQNNSNLCITTIIPKEGYVLKPGILYIGSTVETIASDKFISAIDTLFNKFYANTRMFRHYF